jgi:hypothetical protein
VAGRAAGPSSDCNGGFEADAVAAASGNAPLLRGSLREGSLDDTIGYGDGGAPSSLEQGSSFAGVGGGLAQAVRAANARAAPGSYGAHEGDEEEEGDEDEDGEGDEDGGASADSQEAWRRKWAAGSAGSDSEGAGRSSDEGVETEKSLAEFQAAQRRQPSQPKQLLLGSPEAALQRLLAQAAAGGAARLGSPAAVASLLEQLAAQARQLAPHPATPPPLLKAPPSAPAAPSPPPAAAAAAAAARCGACGRLPVARHCLECAVRGCAACWSQAHKQPALRGHRFELVGLARAQVKTRGNPLRATQGGFACSGSFAGGAVLLPPRVCAAAAAAGVRMCAR